MVRYYQGQSYPSRCCERNVSSQLKEWNCDYTIHLFLLTGNKWKKLNLAEFAKDFKMQEMEKQAYLLSKVKVPAHICGIDIHLCISYVFNSALKRREKVESQNENNLYT